jgi:DHA1 family bicyclomycin/chloramphenicol resistance-like MFS transporter
MNMHAGEPPKADVAKPRPYVALWLLTVITFSGTLGMHIFVPALPHAADDLHASMAAMQMTVSLYIAGLAVGQLVYGPLSDRFGRRPVLIAGLVLYTVSGLAAAFAPEVYSLIAARLFQSLGGCTGLVIGRAMVRDTSESREMAGRRLALMNLMVLFGPGLAPLVGSILASTLGWRSIFLALAALGVVNLLLTWRLLPETGASGQSVDVKTLARHYRELLASPSFLGYSVAGGCATTSMYAFIAAAPFVFVHQLNRPAYEVGIYLGIVVSGIWVGTMVSSRLIMRVSIDRLAQRANLLNVGAAFGLLAAVVTGHLSAPLAIGCMFVLTVGAGLAAPAALTQAVSVNPHVIGSASGLYGFTQMAVGALCTALGGLGSDPALASALVLAGAAIVSQLAYWVATRQKPVRS